MTASLRRSLVVLVAATALLGSVAFANGVVDPVPDYRGDPNSVHAIFEWQPGGDSGSPDNVQSLGVLYGYWSTTLFETVAGAYPLDPTTPQAFDDGLNTTVELPNFIDPLPIKHMRITMGFDGPVDFGLLQAAINVSAVDPQGTPTWGIVGGGELINGSVAYYVDIDIEPNPDSETIAILGDVNANIVPGNLLTIEIDTVSVPEPMTMSLLAAGGLALLKRKRK